MPKLKSVAWALVCVAVIMSLVPAAHAATNGFDQSGAGPYDYNTTTNWVGGTINGLWDSTLTLSGAQTVQFAVDTTLSTGLTFNYDGGFGLTLSSNTGTKTVTLGGDLAVGTVAGAAAAVTIGNSSNVLNVDLGGVARSATISPFRTLTLVNVVSNGGLTKAGAGTLALNGANTFTGGVTLNAGTLSLGAAAALGTSAGTLTIADGTALNSTTSNLVLSTNNPQTWNGGFTFLGSQNLNLGTGAVTLGASPAITVNANTLTVGGAVAGSGLGITKIGTGTLQLSSAAKSTFDGGLVLRAGTLRLDFTSATTPAGGLVADANPLTLGGGDLTVVAKSNVASAQTLGATTINTGRSVVTVNGTGTGTMNLTTGGWTRNPGGTVNVVLGTNGTLTAAPTLTNSIIGPWATFNSAANTRYATVSAGTIASSTGTTAADASALTDTTGTVNYELTAATGTTPASMSANTIRYAGGAATTAPGATLFSVNGLLHAGSGTWTIGTNALTIGDSRELVVNAANNAVTISSIIRDNAGGASGLVKDGTNTLTLSGANTHSGGTTLNSGTLNLKNPAALGTGTFTINGGALGDDGTTFTSSTNNAIVINGNFSKPDTVGRVINLGNGAVTLNRPVVISISAHPIQFGGTITGPGGLNALDIIPNGTNSSQVILSSNITLRGNQIVTTQGSSGVLRIDGVISDGGNAYGFTVDGSGSTGGVTLQNNVTHTFTGPVSLQNSGSLGVLGRITPSTLTIGAGSTLTLGNGDLGTTGSISASTTFVNNGTFSIGRNTTTTQGVDFPSLIAGVGGLTKGNHGTIVLNAQNTFSGSVTVSGNSGGFAINADPVGTVGNITSGPLGRGTLVINGQTVRAASTTPRTILNPVTVGGTITLGNATDNGKLTFAAPVTLTGMRTISTASAVDFTGTVGGAGGGFTKTGSATLTLAAGNTFAGGVTLGDAANNNEGTVVIAADSSLGSTSGPLTFNNGTLQFATGSNVTLAAARSIVLNASRTGKIDTSLAAATVDSVITGSGGITKLGANTLTLNAENTHSGLTTVSGGTIRLGAARALQFSGFDTTGSNVSGGIGLDLNGVTALTIGGLSGGVNLSNAMIGHAGLTALTLNPPSGSLTYSGVIADASGPLPVTKSGSGTQVLSGTNTFTGSTTVTGGLLQVTGALAAGSAVGVSGGAIGGSGNGTTTGLIGGSVTLTGTGGVDLRNAAIGTLTVGGNLAINGAAGASPLTFDLGSGTGGVDKIVVGGATTMTTAGAAVIVVNPTSTTRVNAGTYALIQGTGGVPAVGEFRLGVPAKAFGLGFSLGVSGSELQLTTTQLAAGPAAPGWTGATDGSWATASNWSSAAAPNYQSNVTLYTTAANLSTTLGEDFDVNSLSFPAAATSALTVGGSNWLTIEATTANSNSSGNGITVATPAGGTPVHTISANVGLAANQTWTVNTGGTLTVSGKVSDFGLSRAFTKSGAGRLNLDGASVLGSLTVNSGTLGVGSGGSVVVGTGPASAFNVAVNSSGTLDASTSQQFTADVGSFLVGTGTSDNSTGVVRLGLANTITAATTVRVGANGTNETGTLTTAANGSTTIRTPIMTVGGIGSLGRGTFTLGSGATLDLEGSAGGRAQLVIGQNTGAGTSGSWSYTGTVDLTGGRAGLTLSSLAVGQMTAAGSGSYSGVGTLTLGTNSANSLDVSGPGTVVRIGDNRSAQNNTSGTVTIGNLAASSVVRSTSNATAILIGNQEGSGNVSGTLNLNGGTLTITTTGAAIAGGGGTSTLNLNGMTLKPGASTSTFLSGLTNARMFAGGLTIDTDGKTITVPQALTVAPAASSTANFGLQAMTTLTPTAGGSGYTTPPSVSFNTPSGGTPATGVAQINPAGQVTGILITNPGSGYTNGAAATITLSGGGGTGATFTNPTATISQTGGGLTKIGAGTLALSGVNTYTGATTVSAGTLALVSNGSINTSPLTLAGGRLRYDSSVAYSGTFTFSSGSIGGTNLTGSLGGLSIGPGQSLAPGVILGTANTSSQIWDVGGTYLWDINDANGTAGDATAGWDLINGTSSLAVFASSSSPFTVAITSLSPANTPGSLFGFDPEANYAWKIADFAAPVIGFDSAAFTVNTAGFVDAFNGSFSVAEGSTVTGGDSSQLYVVYTVPEPATFGLLAAGVILAAGLLGRWRHDQRDASDSQ